MRSLILTLIIIFLNVFFITSVGSETLKSTTNIKLTEANIYRVGVNDVIEIKVLDHTEFNSIATVSSDGSIIIPYIGAVFVKEKTLKEIEDEITKKLSEGYLKYPVVSISLIKSMSKAIFIYGEIGRPGMYPIEEGMTTVLRILSVAGGITTDGIHGKVILRRKDKKSSEYKEILLGTKDTIEKTEKGNFVLFPHDILIIEKNKTFLIQGEVARRGRYALEKNMTVVKALIDAGGVSSDGLHGYVKVRRKTDESTEGYKVIAESRLKNGIILDDKVEEIELHPDDILLVERNHTFLIQGEVLKPGRYILEKDMTVLRALLEAGGVTEDGRYGKLKLRHKQEGNTAEYIDIAVSKLTDGVIESSKLEDTVINADDIVVVERNRTFFIYGEVGRTGRFMFEDGMTATKAISIAGGITPNGLYGKIVVRRKDKIESLYVEKTIEVKKTSGNNMMEDVLLQPDDTLIVERNNVFFLYGEFNKPGEYILKDGTTVFQAITIAGGFTKWGSEGRIKILRSQANKTGFEIIKVDIGNVIKGDSSSDIILQPGDTVVASSGGF